MDLVPSGLFPLLALAVTAVGLALVLRRGVPKAYGLGMVMMVVFLVDIVGRMTGQSNGVQGELGFVATSERFQWWSPLTSAFVHAAPGGRGSFFSIHLIGNLFILLTAGPALEERVGERKFLVIFFLAHLGALVIHTLMPFVTPAFLPPGALALGASGGIFGVLTAFAMRYPREKLPILLLFFVFWMQASLVLLIYLGFNVAYFLGDFLAGSPTGIGWWGHFAGFFVGLAFARTLPAVATLAEPIGSTKGLPDPAKLEPLATTPELKRILERVRQFTPESRTAHDSTFALTWVDKFLSKATCPEGHSLERSGLVARCAGGETVVDLSRAS